ncbi:MAG: hypothetical protein HND27_06970 [Bacteroidetes bacterium]|nr:hypothetical protein [Flavobacteriales bacterium]MCL4816432.1 hypothetical protein [Flavobacteriales bacterium]NOG95506.1 hypothetical protein [Bacteroidota bacterium]WKZ73954.1 MAG: hypothetical protein QY303_07290 [Vicingaceae bacterium]CAG0973234.1 hypothetical protein FLAV_01355 [Flavobacteriales bacterium]
MLRKTYFFVLTMLFLLACTPEKLNETEASKTAENLLNTLNEEKYDSISSFCTASYNNGENTEKRKRKYIELKKVLGSMQSYERINTEHITNAAEPAFLVLTYKVVYNNATTQEMFTLTKEEGKIKISDHNVRTENTL